MPSPCGVAQTPRRRSPRSASDDTPNDMPARRPRAEVASFHKCRRCPMFMPTVHATRSCPPTTCQRRHTRVHAMHAIAYLLFASRSATPRRLAACCCAESAPQPAHASTPPQCTAAPQWATGLRQPAGKVGRGCRVMGHRRAIMGPAAAVFGNRMPAPPAADNGSPSPAPSTATRLPLSSYIDRSPTIHVREDVTPPATREGSPRRASCRACRLRRNAVRHAVDIRVLSSRQYYAFRRATPAAAFIRQTLLPPAAAPLFTQRSDSSSAAVRFIHRYCF